HWLKRAADGGIIAGQVEYAIMLFNGVGVEKNEAAAAKIFLRAAAHNNPIAQNRLAHLYVSGRGVPRDLVEAATWNRFAKAAGIEDAELDAATANLTPAENERVNQLVRRQAAF
ncbi:MAG: tetratricopeptide repeat protein, partial [Roseiarcus sp.]